MGIEELTVNPKKINIIEGDNEKNKTSLLNGIEKALRNNSRRTRTITEGEEEAILLVDISEGEDLIEIDRRIRRTMTDTFKVKTGGKSIKKPDAFLKTIYQGLAFNPVDFMLNTEKKKSEIILSLIEIPISDQFCIEHFKEVPPVTLGRHGVEVLQDIEKHYYKSRSEVNTKIDTLKSEIGVLSRQLPDNYEGDKWVDASLQEAISNLNRATNVNTNLAKAEKIVTNGDSHEKDLEVAHNELLNTIKEKYRNDKEISDKTVTEGKLGIEKLNGNIKDLQVSLQTDLSAVDTWVAESIEQIKAQATEKKEKINRAMNDHKEELNFAITDIYEQIAQAQAKLDNLDTLLDSNIKSEKNRYNESTSNFTDTYRKAKAYIDKYTPIDLRPLQEEATLIEKMKSFIPIFENIKRIETDELASLKQKSNNLTEKITHSRALPSILLKSAEKPVDGIDVDENFNVTYKGLPLDNMSTKAEMKFAVEIARSLAKESELKIICIDKFEHFSPKNQAIFLSEIENDEFQYFITKVSDGDMRIKSMNPEPKSEPKADRKKVVSVDSSEMTFDVE